MELGNYEPTQRPGMVGDNFPAKDNVNKPLIVFVREFRTGVKTKFNSDPTQSGYKPEGADAVILDIVDLTDNSVHVGALWMNPAITDNLADKVGTYYPIELRWTTPQRGGSQYVAIYKLDGEQLAFANEWATKYGQWFEQERDRKLAEQAAAAEAAMATSQETLALRAANGAAPGQTWAAQQAAAGPPPGFATGAPQTAPVTAAQGAPQTLPGMGGPSAPASPMGPVTGAGIPTGQSQPPLTSPPVTSPTSPPATAAPSTAQPTTPGLPPGMTLTPEMMALIQTLAAQQAQGS